VNAEEEKAIFSGRFCVAWSARVLQSKQRLRNREDARLDVFHNATPWMC
jgi:hypothetical protein